MSDLLRAVFFAEEDARAVASRLAADGYAASVQRERLAGEDDDEDHPWAVLSDAPVLLVEILVDEHDGWLDEDGDIDGGASRGLPPLDLPAAPRRIKRPSDVRSDLSSDLPSDLPGDGGGPDRARPTPD